MASKLIPIRDASVCREPTLAEMLADPIVKAVMRADAVDAEEIEALFGRLRRDRPSPRRVSPCVSPAGECRPL
jgi:hypothetical protein